MKHGIISEAKRFNVNFFDVITTIEEIGEPEKREKIKQECLTEHALAPCPPFAVINPSQIEKSPDNKVRLGRDNLQGFVDSLDPRFSDFTRLHKLVLKIIREDLVNTLTLLYDSYEKELIQKTLKSEQAQ